MRTALATLTLLAASAQPAFAQEPLELGVIRNDDIHVVQKNLYPKTDRTELGVHLGVMPFDAYVWTPNAQLSFNSHMSESMSVSVVAGGGYGLKTGAYRTMESPAYGVAPYAFRYLGSVIGDLRQRRAHIAEIGTAGDQRLIHAQVPLRRMFGYSTDLRSLTKGRSTFTMEFHAYDNLEAAEAS